MGLVLIAIFLGASLYMFTGLSVLPIWAGVIVLTLFGVFGTGIGFIVSYPKRK